ncbi:hypothetical protein HYN69_14220 [Gemmobacter aquarius]|uniref:MOSC domain-containing protein n=1 Tax=Paragemmobacter aquarius TaxID=2169400 RepID=A0A2S0UNV5_9RHOB|nr:hypothetical protein [Gemmobacter aquarius]AWB49499.1 hypothetical protein HYN69_14220 [Gemmobacter aquarius]
MKTTSELMAALPHVLAAPRDAAPVLQLCFRPDYGQRAFPERLEMTRAGGIPGERWAKAPWLKLPDGTGDPAIQVSILPKRVLDLVWHEGDAAPHPGDTIIADLETSLANLPEGTLLECGTALLRVSSVFNDACVKWKVRYGQDAKDWVTAAGHPELRLRGVLCSIERDGVVTLGDVLRKV